MPTILGISSFVVAGLPAFAVAAVRGDSGLGSRLRAIETRALPFNDDEYSWVLADGARARITAANQHGTKAWKPVRHTVQRGPARRHMWLHRHPPMAKWNGRRS